MFSFDLLRKKPKPAVKIRAHRGFQILGDDGKMLHLEPGDEASVDADAVRNLAPDDAVILDASKDAKTGKARVDPSPARGDVRPAPEAWASLPKCFTEYHDISERFRVAREHIAAVKAKRIELFGIDIVLGSACDQYATITTNRPQIGKPNEGIVLWTKQLNLADPELRFQDRCLMNAGQAAEDHLTRLREQYGLKIQELHLQCGYERLDGSHKLQRLIDEVRETAFAIFRERLAPLGLAEAHERNLYCGSAVAIKYRIDFNAYTGAEYWTGYDENGVNHVYVEDSVGTSASVTLMEREHCEKLTALLLEARKELSKTKKAALTAA